MKNINDWLGQKITDGVATMECAYLFAVIALIGFPYGSHSARVIIQWFAQEFLQLVLLSIILVGQKLQADTTIRRVQFHADRNHEKHMDELKKIKAHLGIKEK